MCSVYDGVAETIAELKNRGKKIFVATSKPEVYTKQIIEQKKLSDLFGENINSPHSCKSP